ncbi:MAG: HAMP domain-containing sensor histidine kinase, partial [Planctomycetota bacterium]
DGFARALLYMEEQDGRKEPAVSEKRREFLSIISQESQRLSKLIEDVLDLSEAESSYRRQAPEQFSAKALFEESLASLTDPQPFPEVTVRLTPAGAGPSIFADRASMIQVVRELLINARKFSGAPEIVLGAELVSIRRRGTAQAPGSVMRNGAFSAALLYVEDQGVGIAPEDLRHIFEKFHRGERAVSSAPGMGLGLSIARTLVSQNDGRIWVDSSPGSGTTFYMLLPSHPPGDTRP